MYIVICSHDPHYPTPAHLLPSPWPQFLTTDPTSQIPPPSPIVTNSHPQSPSIRLNYSKPQLPNSQTFWLLTSPLASWTTTWSFLPHPPQASELMSSWDRGHWGLWGRWWWPWSSVCTMLGVRTLGSGGISEREEGGVRWACPSWAGENGVRG